MKTLYHENTLLLLIKYSSLGGSDTEVIQGQRSQFCIFFLFSKNLIPFYNKKKIVLGGGVNLHVHVPFILNDLLLIKYFIIYYNSTSMS